MKNFLLLFVCLLLTTISNAQNVGIGVPAPAHKLDVNGNINLSGSIKTNGTDGQPNQVLMTNSTGNTVWANISSYREYVSFGTAGATTWTVPEGVTRILVEAWGAGGGGSCVGGGGGGGYINAYFTVTPGNIVSLSVGNNGSGNPCGSTTTNSGGVTTATINGTTITAYGGAGSYAYSATGHFIGRGGGYGVSPSTFRNWFAVQGEDGQPNEINYIQANSTTTLETTKGGRGGSAGNTPLSESGGGYAIYNFSTASVTRYVTAGNAKVPGGGGGGNVDRGASYSGGSGADGRVTIHY